MQNECAKAKGLQPRGTRCGYHGTPCLLPLPRVLKAPRCADLNFPQAGSTSALPLQGDDESMPICTVV